ncbi:MAG: ATP-binding cassette domain-containing protein [Clostridium sp.]|nr:ATP-binding cassette domain-containing protein [Clostridium sp.]
MLKLENINKSYNNELILKNINLYFENTGFISILGPSGSGKTTLLNIISGLIKPDSGTIQYNNLLLNKFNRKSWDSFRTYNLSYIFQDYKLLEDITVIDNIKIVTNNNNKIKQLLAKLEINKIQKQKVNKLSGGEKQRVAIARALANDPDILLADEPTGALDTINSVKIMNILKEISKNKLVIIVTHNIELAKKYSDKIIYIKDGTTEHNDYIKEFTDIKTTILKKNKSSIKSIIKLALNGLKSKKKRTILTSLASSIGIITMALVLLISNGFNKDLKNYEETTLSKIPITISNGIYEKKSNSEELKDNQINIKKKDEYLHENNIDNNYLNYINKLNNNYYISYKYDINLPLLTNKYKYIDISYFNMIPYKDNDYIKENYNIIYGRNINNYNEVLLAIDENNMVEEDLLMTFGINTDIEYNKLINTKIKIIPNDIYYKEENNYFIVNNDLQYQYNNGIELTIVGIVKEKEPIKNISTILYNKELIDKYLTINENSKIVKKYLNTDNVIIPSNTTKDKILSYLGYKTIPYEIEIYANNIYDKENLIKYLDNYNKEEDKIIYIDITKDMLELLKNIINIITIVLVTFSLISLIVASIMISIITNMRVLERTKDIGILRSIGKSRKTISRLFNIENILIGIISSIISSLIVYILVNPINILLNKLLDMGNILEYNYKYMLILSLLNITITMLSGYIPSKKASKKEIITCFNT